MSPTSERCESIKTQKIQGHKYAHSYTYTTQRNTFGVHNTQQRLRAGIIFHFILFFSFSYSRVEVFSIGRYAQQAKYTRKHILRAYTHFWNKSVYSRNSGWRYILCLACALLDACSLCIAFFRTRTAGALPLCLSTVVCVKHSKGMFSCCCCSCVIKYWCCCCGAHLSD